MIKSLSKTYKASSEHLYSEIGSDGVILDIKSGIYYGLNDVGNQIWHWLQAPKPVSELLNLLLEEYDVTKEQATVDLQSLLQEMLDTGLIETVNEETIQTT